MAFESQSKSSGLMAGAKVVISQSYKPSSGSEELSVRVDINLLSKVGLLIGDRADVLFDKTTNQWMVKKSGKGGFKISGKNGAPKGLIRYTLKEGHTKLSDERSSLPVKKELDESSLVVGDDNFIFMLK
jgi:hypothetical protein